MLFPPFRSRKTQAYRLASGALASEELDVPNFVFARWPVIQWDKSRAGEVNYLLVRALPRLRPTRPN